MSSRAPTAQLMFTEMLRSDIAPRLRALGFKGSGARYLLPDDERWLILAFQKDYYSRADYVRFTVNLTVADKRVWSEAREDDPSLPPQPSGNVEYMSGDATMIRLGNLMPPRGEDRWWEVGPTRPSGRASQHVLNEIERLAVEWLRRGATPGQRR